MEQIKENDYKVKIGMYDFRLDEEPARHSLGYIMNDLRDIKQSYFKLGFHLNEFNRLRYYENLGFLSFKDFCAANLPIDMSAVKRCIQVFKMTCQYNSDVPTMFMKDEYKPYGYSQLCEMVTFKDETFRGMISPDMTIKQIRELKKGKISSADKRCDVAPRKPAYSFLCSAFDKENYNDVMICLKNYLLGELGQDMSSHCYTGKVLTFKFKDKQYKLQLSVMKGV